MIGLTKTPNVTACTVGQYVTYTISLSADPTADDTSVLLNDLIPRGSGKVFQSASQNPSDPTQFANVNNPPPGGYGHVQWTADVFPHGQTATFSLVVKASAVGTFNNNVRYTSQNVPTEVRADAAPVVVS